MATMHERQNTGIVIVGLPVRNFVAGVVDDMPCDTVVQKDQNEGRGGVLAQDVSWAFQASNGFIISALFLGVLLWRIMPRALLEREDVLILYFSKANMPNYYFIMVGGGSSGAALAANLAAKGPTRLLERGTNATTAFQQHTAK